MEVLMNRYQQNGVERQLNSMTREEAIKAFTWSCNHCYFAMHCIQCKCPIAKAHQDRMTYLDTGLQNNPITYSFPTPIKEKPKKEIPWQTKALKAVVRYLDKCYEVAKVKKNHHLMLLLDDITVQISIDKSTQALDKLRDKYEIIFFTAAKRFEKYNPNAYLHLKRGER
jgi:hypothetical protein